MVEIIQGIFSHYNEIKLKVNNGRKTRKFINMWKLNHKLLEINVKEKSQDKLENT